MRRAVVALLLLFTTATSVFAQSVNVGSDTTITSNVTGTAGTNGGADVNGGPAGPGINWVGSGVDVVINPNLTVHGGAGGAGGADASNDGGNSGGDGGPGLYLQSADGTLVTNTGDFIYGGAGGHGSNGGIGGANDTAGGLGGVGGFGVYIIAPTAQLTFNGTTVVGGIGGNSGDVGDTAAANTVDGQQGAGGGSGIFVGADTTINLVSSSVSGGNGGNAGGAVVGGTNGSGGSGGDGIVVSAGVASISIDANSTVAGGSGGAAGTGGSGGAAGRDGNGIFLFGSDASVTNHGLVQGAGAPGGGASGIAISGNTTSIDNFGTIQAPLFGVWVLGNSTLTTLHNELGGLVQGTNAVSVLGGSQIVNFTNDGTLTAVGSSWAIDVVGQVGVITNAGTINGGVRVTSDFAGMGLNNSGMIDGQVQFTGTGDHSFTFQNGSVLTGGVLGGAGGDYVTLFGGAIGGAMDLAGGTNQVLVSGIFETGSAMRATGGGLFLSVGGAGVLNVGNLVSDVLDLDVASGGQIHISNATVTGSGSLNNLGTVIIDGDAHLDMGTMTAGGAYVFGINAMSEAPRITLASGAVDFTGASLQIAAQPSNAMFDNGSNWIVAQGGGAALGITNGQQVADNSALLNFYLYRGDALFGAGFDDEVYVQAVLALLADIASHADDPNAVGVGGALDVIGFDGNGAIDQLMLQLALLPTNAAINDVLDSLLSETDGVAADIATDAGDQILDVASRRLDGLRGTVTAGLAYEVAALGNAGLRGGLDRKGTEVWGQTFGRIVDQRRHDYNEGYGAEGYGFAAGVDTAFDGGRSLIGGTFAFGQTSADSDTINRTETDVDSYQFVFYGDHLFENGVYAKGMLGYGWHENDIARHDVGGPLGPTVTASYDAWQFTARAETGRAYRGDANLTLVPHLTANYAYYDPDDYTEALAGGGEAIPGGGGLALDVRTENLQSFRLGLGVLARWDIAVDGDVQFFPELRLNYRRELIGDRFETTSEFVGAPGLASFDTRGVEPARDILNLGVGALLATAAGVDVRASYDLELKDDYTAHGGYVRASVSF